MAWSITGRNETGPQEPYRHVRERIPRPTGRDYPKESRAMIEADTGPGDEREAGPERQDPRAGPETQDRRAGTPEAGLGGRRRRAAARAPAREPQYWNSSSRYFGNGQSSSATCDSSASATSRSFACAGITWSRNAFASAMTDPASCASCCACSRSWIASTSESASDETFSHMCVTPRDDGPAADSRPRYVTAAGRTRVLAMSRAHDASMFETLT